MNRLKRTATSSLVVLVSCICFLACDDPIVAGGAAPPPGAGAAAGGGRGLPTPAGGGAAPAAAEEEAEEPPPPLVYRDEDFVELDTGNRDPFRSFANIFKVQNVSAPQRRVLLPMTSIDEMRLIAIISGVAQPRAMLQDPNTVGHVVKRGDYIGRAEVIQTGGSDSMPVTLNWRVDRIRAGEVVLTRDDPTAPDRPPLTRVIALHEDDGQPAS